METKVIVCHLYMQIYRLRIIVPIFLPQFQYYNKILVFNKINSVRSRERQSLFSEVYTKHLHIFVSFEDCHQCALIS